MMVHGLANNNKLDKLDKLENKNLFPSFSSFVHFLSGLGNRIFCVSSGTQWRDLLWSLLTREVYYLLARGKGRCSSISILIVVLSLLVNERN
jgi:hypothetical protein